MKMSEGYLENDIYVGNFYNKYSTNNIIYKFINKNFKQKLFGLIKFTKLNNIIEIGCGEGYWTIILFNFGFNIKGYDFSNHAISLAKNNAINADIEKNIFDVKNIYDLNFDNDNASLILCLEVLEHLEFPNIALEKLQNITENYIILSVPNEPLWRILNFIRLKYLKNLGNTPGHLNHWSSKNFINLISNYFDIIKIENPTPWIMILCKKKINFYAQ